MKETIKKDLYRYGGTTSFLKGIRKEGFRYTYFFRKASTYKKLSPFGLTYRLILKKLSYKYGFQIPINTKIGEGLYINHYGPVVINEGAIIGKNFTVSQSVTVGQTNRGKRKGCPVIKDNVFVGAGSVIVGNIVIGNNVLIAFKLTPVLAPTSNALQMFPVALSTSTNIGMRIWNLFLTISPFLSTYLLPKSPFQSVS